MDEIPIKEQDEVNAGESMLDSESVKNEAQKDLLPKFQKVIEASINSNKEDDLIAAGLDENTAKQVVTNLLPKYLLELEGVIKARKEKEDPDWQFYNNYFLKKIQADVRLKKDDAIKIIKALDLKEALTDILSGISREGFIIKSDFITDTRTGLVWSRNVNYGGRRNWDDAMKYVALLSDRYKWRLPTRDELTSLMKSGGGAPRDFLNNLGFTGVPDNKDAWHWTSTEDSYNNTYIWISSLFDCSFLGGHRKCTDYYVWPVRSDR